MDGIYQFNDTHNNTLNYGITLDTFREIPIDIIIASIPQHIEPFKKLADMKGAKLIYQIGNQWNIEPGSVKNVLASAKVEFPTGVNGVIYHQEFDLAIFRPSGRAPKKEIDSFINILPRNGGFSDYINLQLNLPEYEFKSYGAQTTHGVVSTTWEMAQIMQEAYLGFHIKSGGDGYGHVLHNWLACGKPVITRLSDYKGKLAEPLLIDGETCLDLDSHSLEDIIDDIRNMNPTKYEWMCQRTYQVFKDNVDFDKDAELVKEFLNNLQ